MKEEKLYDYSKGLNAPYWIQEIKTKKGTRIWYFATPMQLSFFYCLHPRLCGDVTVWRSHSCSIS